MIPMGEMNVKNISDTKPLKKVVWHSCTLLESIITLETIDFHWMDKNIFYIPQ